MKTRFLLCMMALWAMCAAAQPPQMPQSSSHDHSYYLLSGPHHSVDIQPLKSERVSRLNATPASCMNQINKVSTNQPTHQVDIILDYDTESQKPEQIVFITDETNYDNTDLELYQLQKGSNIMPVPEGTYDIFVTFQELDTTQPYEQVLNFRHVIHEQVNIGQDMELSFAASEAKNHIHCQTLNKDGEPVNTGTYAFDENWNYSVIEQGNTDDVLMINQVALGNYSFNFSCNFGATYEGEVFHQLCRENYLCDFYVNDVSERVSFFSYRLALKDYTISTSSYGVRGASNDTTITNDPSSFELLEFPYELSHTEGLNCGYNFTLYDVYGTGQGGSRIFTDPLPEGETIKLYLSAQAFDGGVELIPVIRLTADTMNADGYYDRVMQMPCVTGADGHARFIYDSSTSQAFVEYKELLDDGGNPWAWDYEFTSIWPPHPVFSYPIEQMKGKFFNNCPMLLTRTYNYEDADDWRGAFRIFKFDFSYFGRYSEQSFADVANAHISIKLDGEEILTGNGTIATEIDELLNGVVDATIINESVIVDDMEGFNKAQLHYTAGAEDQDAPTMTMLHFKDSNDDVTDRFSTANEGVLEFSAGDYNHWISPHHYIVYDRQAPESVEVSYSPYGEDNWNELAVEEGPENYWPVMGWFYTGSLAGVTGQGLNGWFDLKIRLTDAAGNWQEQVISPAFRIDDLAYSSVVTITPDKVGDNTIYNLAGQRMRGGLESLPHGIYIVGGKKVVK